LISRGNMGWSQREDLNLRPADYESAESVS
jgi:hypothetical protein